MRPTIIESSNIVDKQTATALVDKDNSAWGFIYLAERKSNKPIVLDEADASIRRRTPERCHVPPFNSLIFRSQRLN